MLQIIKELLHEQRDRRGLRRDAGKDERAAAGQGAPDPSGGGRQRPPEPAPAPPLIQAGAAVPYTGYPAPSFGPGTRQGASAGLPPNAPLNPPGYPQIPPRTPIDQVFEEHGIDTPGPGRGGESLVRRHERRSEHIRERDVAGVVRRPRG